MKDSSEEQKTMGEIIISLATKISKLEKKIIDIKLWEDKYGGGILAGEKKLREILER